MKEYQTNRHQQRVLGSYQPPNFSFSSVDAPNSQRKNYTDDGSNVSVFGNPKQLQGKNNKEEHMPVSVDNHAGTYKLKWRHPNRNRRREWKW